MSTDALMIVVFLGICVWILWPGNRTRKPLEVLDGLIRGRLEDPFRRLAVSAHETPILAMNIRLDGEGIESHMELDQARAYGFSSLSNSNRLYVRESQFDRARTVLVQSGFGGSLVPPIKHVHRAEAETTDSPG